MEKSSVPTETVVPMHKHPRRAAFPPQSTPQQQGSHPLGTWRSGALLNPAAAARGSKVRVQTGAVLWADDASYSLEGATGADCRSKHKIGLGLSAETKTVTECSAERAKS
jgi:hypothetical protein